MEQTKVDMGNWEMGAGNKCKVVGPTKVDVGNWEIGAGDDLCSDVGTGRPMASQYS